MLDKRLQLGGLQVGGPRTLQNTARFRVANNIYQTKDGYLVPRFHAEEYLDGFEGAPEQIVHITRYQDAPAILAIDATNKLMLYHNSTTQVVAATMPALTLTGGELPGDGIQSYEKLGCLFFMVPGNGLFKYDGTHVHRAGVPVPQVQMHPSYLSGTKDVWVRFMQHYVDFQGNVANSGYLTLNVNMNAFGTPDNIAVETGANVPGYAGDLWPYQGAGILVGTRPEIETLSMANNYFAYFMKVTSDVNDSANRQIVCTVSDANVVVGAYLVHHPDAGISYGGPLDGISILGLAYRVKAINSPTEIVLDLDNAKYMDYNHEWHDVDLLSTQSLSAIGGTGAYLSAYWITVWASQTETGTYLIQSVIPSCNAGANTHTFSIDLDPTTPAYSSWSIGGYNIWNLTSNMGDWYDVTSVKRVFVPDESKAFTEFSELGMIAYSNLIQYSDTTLGGAFEMTNGLAFFVVGDQDDGDIQTICGNSDFFFTSRKYRNYYLSGNIPTANYRVQEIPETSLGAYSNECSLLVGDKILFFNKQGVWAVYTGGRCEEISYNIRGFFDNSSGTLAFDEQSYYDLSSFDTYAGTTNFVRLRLDIVRNLLAFMIKGADGQGQILILNLNNGEFFTWSGMFNNFSISGSPKLNDIFFLDGYYYVTVNTTGGKAVYKENKDIPRVETYMEPISHAYNPRLKTTWLTAAEPSLEKKTKQLKMWGIIDGTVGVRHALDWSKTESVDDGVYECEDTDLFSHKKRMESANALACSVDMEFTGERFELEGLEIEYELYQGQMKR